MKCENCEEGILQPQGDRSRGQYECRFCHSVFEQIVNTRIGRESLTFVEISGPTPEADELLILRAQLRECANIVLRQPKQALLLLEDTWVSFSTVVKDGHFDHVSQVVELREKNAEQARKISSLQREVESLKKHVKRQGPPLPAAGIR